jgi:hypothetical protein
MKISKIFLTLFLMRSVVAFGQDFNETELNNTSLTANILTLPSTIVGKLQATNDVDYFKITVTQGGVLTLNGTTTNESRLDIQVFDQNMVQLARKISNGASQPVILPCIVKAGTYYIVVSNYNNTGYELGGYRIETFLDRTDACEYNGTFNTACLIPSTTTVSGKIWGLDGYTGRRNSYDNDVFKISVTRGGVLLLNLRQIGDGQRPTIRVFNEQQKQLVEKVSPTSVTSFAISANIPDAGTYYIEIEDYNNAQINTLYALDVNFDISETCEYNNNFTKACDYTLGQIYQGKICGFDGNTGAYDNTDSDFLVFNVTSAGTHNFRLNNIPTGSRMQIQIFNDVQQLKSSAVSPTNSTLFNHSYSLTTGRYYIALQDYNGNQFCNAFYKFQIGLATSTNDIRNELYFNLSPNPVNNQLKLSNTEGAFQTLKITNLTGQTLLKKEVFDKQTDIDVSMLAKGLYLLTIETTDGRRGVQKFVKN